jgi:ABC-type multidrug transport system fused ATPase/permease subunit
VQGVLDLLDNPVVCRTNEPKMKLQLILKLFTKREKNQLVFVFFGLLVMGFIELIGVGSIGPFISIITNPRIIHTNNYLNLIYNRLNFETDNQFIVFFGLAVIIVLFLSNLCLAGVNFLIYYYSGKRRHSISLRLFEKYLGQPYIFFLNVNSAELIKRMGDVNVFVADILINFFHMVSGVIISLSIIILLIIINPLLALLISSILGFLYIVIFFLVRKYLVRKGRERNTLNTLRHKFFNEAFGGIKDIKILGKEKAFLNFFSYPSLKYSMNDAISNIVNDLPKYLIETLAIGGILGMVIIMIYSGKRIDEFLPMLTIYAFGAYRLLPLLQKIFKAAASIRFNLPIIENLSRDFNELSAGNIFTDNDIPKLEFKEHIRLENIVFSYPNSNSVIIKNQNILIKHNTSIALVGPTGCGKTTLADLILGLLEPQSGNIFIDDTQLNETTRINWQKNLGYVPQSIYLTDDTIRSNIAFGINPEKIDDEAVMNAAKAANIHDFIMTELKEKYNTSIGERGIRLSGGQRQRIGIARALYHDPSVLILDEATSALDTLTENAIIDAIKYLSHKKTIIMIAHRITTVKACDTIFLMNKGTIVDYGTYNELYLRNESFKKMADGK